MPLQSSLLPLESLPEWIVCDVLQRPHAPFVLRHKFVFDFGTNNINKTSKKKILCVNLARDVQNPGAPGRSHLAKFAENCPSIKQQQNQAETRFMSGSGLACGAP